MTQLNWRYKDLDVHYTPDLDGDGTSMAHQFVDYLKANHADELPFGRCFEWCAGPGFIGYALLAEGICESLVLADINPAACDAARRTVASNGLEDRVSVYTSDNLQQIPAEERFDLVVSNPPNYYCLNPQHPWYAALAGDIRPNDPGWALHRAFYAGIRAFLNEDALLCIEEVDPYAEKCFLPNEATHLPFWGPEPFDLRPRPPIEDFQDMIEAADLTYLRTVEMPHPQLPVHLMISRNEVGPTVVRLRDELALYERVGTNAEGEYGVAAVKSGKVVGELNLSEERLWVVDLVELLNAERTRGLGVDEIAERLEVPVETVTEALRALRRQGWLHAPGLG